MKKGCGGVRVMVVGAGLAGLTLAHGLRRAGVHIAVYERSGARGHRQGISLHIDDRGAAVLRACLPPGHVAMAEATMGGPRERTLSVSEVDDELTVLGSRPADGAMGRARPGRQAHRPLLRAVLLTGLADVVRFEARFTRFEQRADGTVQAWFADGHTDTADVLVGADGIGSAVRRQLRPEVRVVDAGRRMLMGATPLRALAGGGLPELIGDDPAGVRTRDTTMALAVLRFAEPPPAARERWLPTLHPGAVADAEDYLMWALPTTPERAGQPASPAELTGRARELVEGLHPALRQVVDEAWPDLTVALRLGTIPPMPARPPGPVTLVGDAVHLAPGFGGNLALRDACRLRDALVEAAGGRCDLLAAIGAYEEAARRDWASHWAVAEGAGA